MNIVAVTACTAGIAHTYIVAEKLQKAAEELGHNIKVETQGSAGIENELTAKDIADADVVIYTHDIAIRNTDRFAGKKIVDVPISTAMKQPKSLISTIEKKLAKQQIFSKNEKREGKIFMKFTDLRKHVMTGISFLIPMVVMAGITGAIQKAFAWSGVPLSDPTINGLAYSGYSIFKVHKSFINAVFQFFRRMSVI